MNDRVNILKSAPPNASTRQSRMFLAHRAGHKEACTLAARSPHDPCDTVLMIRRRSVAHAVLVVWAATALSAIASLRVCRGGEGYANFWVTNNTEEQLTVTSYPVAIPPSNNLASPAFAASLSQSRSVGPGKRAAFMFGGLEQGTCVTYTLIAEDGRARSWASSVADLRRRPRPRKHLDDRKAVVCPRLRTRERRRTSARRNDCCNVAWDDPHAEGKFLSPTWYDRRCVIAANVRVPRNAIGGSCGCAERS